MYENYSGNVKVELDLSNYAAKADLKGAIGIDISNSEAKSDIASLKGEVDKIEIDKLKTIPADLSKLINVVESDVFKKTVYDIRLKIPIVCDLVKKKDYYAKISDIETKYFTHSDYNKFTCEILNPKTKETGFVDKFDISGFINNSDLDKKIAILQTKA